MGDKDLSQPEGLLSDTVPEPGAEKKDGSLLEEAAIGSTEAEIVKGEPMAAKAPLLTPKPEGAERERREVLPTSVLDWEATLREQRLRILNILLGSITGIGAVAVGALLIGLAQRPSRLGAYIPYFAAYAVLVGVTLARRLDPTLRATVLIIIAYIVGVFSLLRNGPLGTGGLYLLVAPLLVSILVRQRVGFIAMAVSITVYIAFVIAHYQGWLQPTSVFDLTQLRFVLILGGTFAMIIVGVMFVQWMFNRTLTSALSEAEERQLEVARSRTLLEERADELAAANVLLQKLTLQLQTAVQVSRAATSVLDPSELVQQTVNLVRERFDLYYVGLFLIDESGQWAVLRAATGEAGRQMLERSHRLEVGGLSMVGWCTANAQARIASDVGEGAIRFDGSTEPSSRASRLSSTKSQAEGLEANPLLPETRSETVLPLRSRGRVIGALDIQSTEREAFSQEDVSVLQTMADQVAVAIENVRLLQEMRQTVRELEAASGRYTQESWRAVVRGAERPQGYRYWQWGVEPVVEQPLEAHEVWLRGSPVLTTVQPEAGGDGQSAVNTLAVPMKLRDQVVGVLNLRFEGDPVSSEMISLVEEIANRLALALENARLLEDTQRRAARERLTSEITDKMRRAIGVEDIVQTAVDELSRVLGTSRTFVRLGVAPSSQNDRKGEA